MERTDKTPASRDTAAGGPASDKPPGKNGQNPQSDKKPATKPSVVEIRPVAGQARMKRRHWGLVASFLAVVLLPVSAAAIYMWGFAEDQYASTTGFTVRQEEGGSASALMGGLADFVGAGTGSNAEVLYEFIQSQDIVNKIAERVDLIGHYSQNWPADPAFSIWPGATIEDLVWYWKRMVRVSFDQSTGLIEVQVRAFDGATAQRIAKAIIAASQEMINNLNETARRDSLRYAERDLAEAVERLKSAREALTAFRVRTQIVDPEADIQGRMVVLNNLQQQLAQALVDYDLLLLSTDAGDPRRQQAERRISVIRERIREERKSFSTDSVTASGQDYPTLMAEYESLRVDREFAEQTYRAALTALEAARSNAARQSLYLATYIQPTAPQEAEYPNRFMLVGLVALFALMAWAIMALIYYSLRDRA